MFCNCFFPTVGCRCFFPGNVESHLWRWQVWNMFLLKWGSFPASHASKRKCWRFPEGYCLQFHSCWIHCTSFFIFFLEFAADDLICLAYFPNGNSTPWGVGLAIGGTPWANPSVPPSSRGISSSFWQSGTAKLWETGIQSIKVCGAYYGLFAWNMLD